MSSHATALRILRLIDLTSLNDSDSADSIAALARAAQTTFGPVAAVCVYPQFLAAADVVVKGRIPLATVVNFPAGQASAEAAARECIHALAAGADEIDVVFPWRALIAGDAAAGHSLLRACRAASAGKTLKVIIESGELLSSELIREATRIAIEEGANFVKTSTGKRPLGATLAAAEVMLETIRACGPGVGFKASGGIRSVADAAGFLQLADQLMGPAWARSSTMRFGASSLLDDVLAVLGTSRPDGLPTAASAAY